MPNRLDRRRSWVRYPFLNTDYWNWEDSSFLMQSLRALLSWLGRYTPTQVVLQEIDLWLGRRWVGEEIAHLGFLALTIILLVIEVPPGSDVLAVCLLCYCTVRLFDIAVYELRIILVDAGTDLIHGHILSADRRLLLTALHLAEFVVAFALVYASISYLDHSAFDQQLDSPARAFYQSTIVATFTGLAIATPTSETALWASAAQLICSVAFFVFLFSLTVSSLRPLREIWPRPRRAGKATDEQRVSPPTWLQH